METYIVEILDAEFITHDVKRLKVEKPEDYSFQPGQATEASINKPGLIKQNRPFTFTRLNEYPYLEFTIKTYKERGGVTKAIADLKAGDEIIIHDVWGAIHYSGPGVFFAAGAGVTPFIAILRQLFKDNYISGNKLYFSNKTEQDIILKNEFEEMLGANFYNTITREPSSKYDNRRIDEAFISEKIKDFKQNFYVCGPDKFVADVNQILQKLGASPESVVIEK